MPPAAAAAAAVAAPHLVVVHGHAQLVVELERLSPDDPSEPEAVIAVDRLCLRGNVQNVLLFVQRTHILT